MSHIAPAGPIYQAEQLSGNPLSMTAVWLRYACDKSVRTAGNDHSKVLRRISDGRARRGVTTGHKRVGSMWTGFFTGDPVVDWGV